MEHFLRYDQICDEKLPLVKMCYYAISNETC